MNKSELVKRNSIEVINEKNLSKLLKKKNPIAYCGYETSGEIHIGHLVTITKLMDLKKAGFKVKLLLADLHGALDNTPWDIRKYYDKYIIVHLTCKKFNKFTAFASILSFPFLLVYFFILFI